MNDDADDSTSPPMTLQATVAQSSQLAVKSTSDNDDGDGPKEAKPVSWSDRFSWPGRISLLLAILISPWAFGSYEYWAQWWMVLALLIGLAFWWFETAMNERKSQIFPFLFFPVTAGLLIGLIQIIGLPESIAGVLLGRQTEIFSSYSGIPDAIASVSVDHEGTWHHIRLLVIAIAGVLLGCRYFRSKRDLVLLLSAMSFNGVAIGCFGLIQKFAWNGKLYWYKEVTLGGSPFGPFVNRNNASGYLLICLACAIGLLPIVMSYRKSKGPANLISREMPFWRQVYYYVLEFVAELTAPKLASLIAVFVIAVSVFAALSRGGVVAMLIAGVATIIAYGMARQPKNSSFIFVPMICLLAVLAGWISFGEDLSERFDRIDLANVSENDLRMQHWQDTYPAVGDFGLLGSGLGSYQRVHRLYRTDNENVVFHYAENQYFQALVEAGWVGLFIFFLAWFLVFQCASLALGHGSSPTTIGMGTMGMFLIFSQATVSLFDFSFYIPANMLALSVLFGFLCYHAQALGGRLKKKSWLHFQIPNYVVQVLVLMLFASVCVVGFDLYSRSRVQEATFPHAKTFTPKKMTIEKTDQKLAALMPAIQNKPSSAGFNYAAALWIHRARLQLLEELTNSPEFETATKFMDEEQAKNYEENLWQLTNVQALQDHVVALSRESKYGAGSFLSKPAIRENLPMAAQLLRYSRRKCALQPTVHLKLGQLRAILEPIGDGDTDIDRAVATSPSNSNFRFVAAIYYLQSGRPEKSATHIQRFLALQPHRFEEALKLLTGRTNRAVLPVDPQLIVDKMVPDDPSMLFTLASRYFPDGSPEQAEILERIATLIENAEVRRHKHVVLLGDVRMMQNDKDAALEQYTAAILTDPGDRATRFKRAQLLVENDKLTDALFDAKYIQDHGPKVTKYTNFLNQVEKLIAERDVEMRRLQKE
ncbi:MAG: O-antigen ligase family protein [Planctomycetota bacterium]